MKLRKRDEYILMVCMIGEITIQIDWIKIEYSLFSSSFIKKIAI